MKKLTKFGQELRKFFDMGPSKKPSFVKSRKIIEMFDAGIGLFFFREPKQKMTRLDKFNATSFPIKVFMIVFTLISTLFVTHFELISIIFCGCLMGIFFWLYVTLMKFNRNKRVLKILVEWCASLYNVEQKYDKMMQKIAIKNLALMEKRSLLTIHAVTITLVCGALFITPGSVIIGSFLPESIYPKFTPAFPYYLPFQNQKSWHAFIITVMVQSIESLHGITLTVFFFDFFYCIVIHIFGVLDMVQEAVSKVRAELFKDINRGTKNSNFDSWMRIITDMISDVNETVSTLNTLYAEFFLLLEITSFSSLFISGLIITVAKQQYFSTILMCYNVLLYSVCLIHEMLLKKLENIRNAMYDLPWYHLDAKQRKMLFMAMKCDQAQRGFTAAGIHTLTVERFGTLLKAGYTNLLVLKDLVAKNV